MREILNIGRKLRPRGGILYGTLGCFATDGAGQVHLVTCDHVLRPPMLPEKDRWNIYFHLDNPFPESVATYTGKTLAPDLTADLAAAECLLEVPRPEILPAPLPESGFDKLDSIIEPAPGIPLWVWGAASEHYFSGTVQDTGADHRWPHPNYGMIAWREQFSVKVKGELATGDSGGPVVTGKGQLAGFISGHLQVGPHEAVAYCVPAHSCFSLMGLELLI